MSENHPELIPMPENNNSGPSPGELSRQLSPEEEKNVLLNFMGNMYGEAKKLDGNIIGPTNTLQRGKSEEIKRQIESVFSQQQPPVNTVPEVQQPQVQAQSQVAPIYQAPQPTQQVNSDENQLSFNFDVDEKEELLNTVEKILTRLDSLHRKVDALTGICNETNLNSKNKKVVNVPVKSKSVKKKV